MSSHPVFFPQTQSRRGLGGKRKDLGNKYFRSCWEANYARYLNFLVSCGEINRWEYEPDTFEFVGIKRGTRFYTPDFKVFNNNGRVVYHEVKGYMDARSATKLKRMAKYHPSVSIEVIDKKRYQALAGKVSGLIKHWEGRLRKD